MFGNSIFYEVSSSIPPILNDNSILQGSAMRKSGNWTSRIAGNNSLILMLKTGVLPTSLVSLNASKGASAYSVAKSSLLHLSRSIALEGASFKIKRLHCSG